MGEPSDVWVKRFDAALQATMKNMTKPLVNWMTELTRGQLVMMYRIHKEKKCTMSKLAQRMEVKPSAITVMLDRLENRGFVVRTRDDEDRRVVNVELTAEGEAAMQEVLRLREQVISYYLAQLAPDELAAMVSALEKLAQLSSTADLNKIIDFTEWNRRDTVESEDNHR